MKTFAFYKTLNLPLSHSTPTTTSKVEIIVTILQIRKQIYKGCCESTVKEVSPGMLDRRLTDLPFSLYLVRPPAPPCNNNNNVF